MENISRVSATEICINAVTILSPQVHIEWVIYSIGKNKSIENNGFETKDLGCWSNDEPEEICYQKKRL